MLAVAVPLLKPRGAEAPGSLALGAFPNPLHSLGFPCAMARQGPGALGR